MRSGTPKILNIHSTRPVQIKGLTIPNTRMKGSKTGFGAELASGITKFIRNYLLYLYNRVNCFLSAVIFNSKVNFFKSIITKKVLSKFFNQAMKIRWHIFQICLMFVGCIIILNFNSYRPKIDQQQQKQFDDFYRNLLFLKRTSQFEWERSNCVKKIVKIINQFNTEIDSALKISIANEIYQMTIKYHNLDIELICATITHESAKTWNPEIVSHANAIGLMQIIPSTGIHLAKEESLKFKRIEDILFDPILNIRLGCRYLSRLIAAYEVDGGLAAYNGGMKRAEIWLQNGRAKGILHEETDKYVPSILKIYEQYLRM